MEHKTFAQFLTEKEKRFTVQHVVAGGSSPTKMLAKGAVSPANPSRQVFTGLSCPGGIFGKDPRPASGVIGKK